MFGDKYDKYIVTARAYDRAVGRGRSPRVRASRASSDDARRRARAMDDLARHRATLGLARDARPTHGEVKAAFKRAARAAHPDAAGCAVKFREVVAARDALLGRGRSRDAAYAGASARASTTRRFLRGRGEAGRSWRGPVMARGHDPRTPPTHILDVVPTGLVTAARHQFCAEFGKQACSTVVSRVLARGGSFEPPPGPAHRRRSDAWVGLNKSGKVGCRACPERRD